MLGLASRRAPCPRKPARKRFRFMLVKSPIIEKRRYVRIVCDVVWSAVAAVVEKGGTAGDAATASIETAP